MNCLVPESEALVMVMAAAVDCVCFALAGKPIAIGWDLGEGDHH